MPTPVSDSRSNANEQIAHAVKVLGRSPDRLAVFEAIYHGKGSKTPEAVAARAKMKRKRVLEEAVKLTKQLVVIPVKDPKRGLLYAPDPFYDANKSLIVGMVKNPKKAKKYPTKRKPQVNVQTAVIVKVPKATLPKKQLHAHMVTIDEVDSFKAVKKVTAGAAGPLPEAQFKAGIASVLGEKGKFTDWGGEPNDLYTTTVKLNGKRVAAAFGFKGPAVTGILTPNKMGKNGDQIQRLFQGPASLFVVQYWGQIAQSVVEQVQGWAQLKSFMNEDDVWFCIINDADSARLVAAYGPDFGVKTEKKRKA